MSQTIVWYQSTINIHKHPFLPWIRVEVHHFWAFPGMVRLKNSHQRWLDHVVRWSSTRSTLSSRNCEYLSMLIMVLHGFTNSCFCLSRFIMCLSQLSVFFRVWFLNLLVSLGSGSLDKSDSRWPTTYDLYLEMDQDPSSTLVMSILVNIPPRIGVG